MDNFEYLRRTHMLFGRGRENEVGSLVKFEGGQRVLLHYGADALRKPDLLDRIKRSLDRAGLEIFELGGVQSKAQASLVYEGIEFCKKEEIDFILAIGRSAVVYSAKAIGVGALYNGDFWDFFTGKREPVISVPVGAVVTTPDAGSECSVYCEIYNQVDNKRTRKLGKNSQTFLPHFAILNPELSLGLSAKDTALSCMDVITHVLERYFTNSKGVSFTDELCEGVLRTIIAMLPRAIEDPNDYDARANLMLAGSLAQNGMCGLGREADWSVQLLESELSVRYDSDHEQGLAVLLPAWMTYCLQHNVMQFARFAHRIFGVPMSFENPLQTARQGIEHFREFLTSVGLPQNFFEMKIPMVDIPDLVANMQMKNGENIGSFVKLDSIACEAIYTLAYSYRHPNLQEAYKKQLEGKVNYNYRTNLI